MTDTTTDHTTKGPQPGRHPHVIAALAAVMAEMPGIGKDAQSPQGYSYRGIEAITAEAQRLLGKHGVVFVPHVQSRKVAELQVNGRPWTEDILEVTYTVYGPGGVDDRIEVGPLWGLGRDNSDKGANKAMTQAFKYALLQTLCIGDSKDDPDGQAAAERDVHPDDLARRDGWEGIADYQEAKADVRARLTKATDERRITRDDGGALWSSYQRPDGADRPGRPRTRAEHDRWVADRLSPVESAPQAPAPDVADTVASSPAPERPQEAPEAGAAPEGPDRPTIGAAKRRAPVEDRPTVLDVVAGAHIPDNGYRDELDAALANGRDLDALVDRIKAMPVPALTDALVLRGVAQPSGTAEQLRARLVGTIVKASSSGQ